MGCGKSTETKEKKIHFIDDIDYRDKYEFISILGKGGFGEVRLYHKKGDINALYAIKTIFKTGNKDIKLKYKEVEILSKLDHPNIVKYYESYEESAFIHLVMEYVNGYNLLKMISAKEIYREQDIAEIIYRLLVAISYIHSKGLVHRDIKAENILFADCNDLSSLKLIDFGLAIESYGKERLKAGTLRYISPEMIQGKFYPKTDCWSVGVLLYFMSTGKYPFDGENIVDYIELGKYNKKLLLTFNLSEELINLIESLIVVDLDKRLSVEEALNHDFLKIREKENKLISGEVINVMKSFSEKSYFDKQILYYLAKLQNTDVVKELNELFLQFDTKNIGIISFDDFKKALNHIDKKINHPEIKKLFDDLDFNHKGFINYSQFIASVSDNLDFIRDEQIYTVFNKFDYDNSGFITKDNFLKAIISYDKNLKMNKQSMEEINTFFEEHKTIDYEKFKKIILENKNILNSKRNSTLKVELINEIKKSPTKPGLQSRKSFSSVSSNK